MNDEKVNYVIDMIKDMDLENRLRLAICMCDKYSHTNLKYDKKEMYKYFDNLLKEINIECRTTTINFANYPYIIFVSSKIMEMDSTQQNKVALYLFNSINFKIKNCKSLDIKNKCFRIYTNKKGCEAMEENKLAIQNELTNEDIKNLIYTIRGKQVMLDSDVARLFEYATKDLNRNVKNNIERFPEYYCFQLTDEEYKSLRCKIFTLNENGRGQHRKYLPYVFTEYGITMLAGLLKSQVAVNVSIKIVNSFIEMRKFLASNGQVFERLTNMEYKLLEHDKKFDIVFDQLQHEENIKQKIFFRGQIYDAYSIIIDIIKKANNKILIMDNYIDDSVLKMLAKKKNNVEVVILTSDKSNIENLDIQKFNKEYPVLKVAKTNKFHDRFIVLDNKEMYHLGASIKDLGKKCFAINKIEDIEIIKKLINL